MGSKAALARAYIRSHPMEFLKLSTQRVGRFWTGAGGKTNSGVVELHVVFTSLLGLLGLGILGKHRPAAAMLFLLPLFLFPLPYYVTHPDFRFRLVLDPLLTILSAYSCYVVLLGIRRAVVRSAAIEEKIALSEVTGCPATHTLADPL